MSLYGQIMGQREYAPALLMYALKRTVSQIPRFRDCYFNKAGQIEILTRTGATAWHGQEGYAFMQAIPGFIDAVDDEWETTFRYWRYKRPLDATITELWFTVGPYEPIVEFRKAIDDLQAGKDTPETRRAMELGKKLMPQIEGLVKSGAGAAVLGDDESGSVTIIEV